MIQQLVGTIAAVGALILLPTSCALSLPLTVNKFGPSPAANSPQLFHPTLHSDGCCQFPCRVPRKRTALRAVAENTITTEACPEADGTDIPTPPGTLPTLTVVAGPGARITSVSSGVAVEQQLWENDADSFPTPDHADVGANTQGEGRVVVDFDPFPEHVHEVDGILAELIKDEHESSEDPEPDSNDCDDRETESTNESSNERESSSSNDPEADDSAIRSAMAKSALLHRAGVAGTTRKSSRSNGRSSWARSHVNKSKRGSGRTPGTGGIGRVLGTMRTAAAAAAQEKKTSIEKSEGGTKPGEYSPGGDENLTENSLTGNPTFSKWKTTVQSTVADMLQNQDSVIQQQCVAPHTETADIAPTALPPGTTSIGVLGEVVHEGLPEIPPRPGTHLVSIDEAAPTIKPQISIRSSIPHSSDDKHIANLRLSVFSRFDEEQQRIFRHRSLEVLNSRRRKGAIVLVAEVQGAGREHRYLNEMESRIASGHNYGGRSGSCAMVSKPSSPSLTVSSVRGATITSVSASIAMDNSLSCTIPNASDKENVPTSLIYGRATSTSQTNEVSIIGSVECSHQEFRGTMLGNSRRQGSLMYVTEVAVKPDARRCGAGAALLKGVDEVAALRNVETIYLHVDVTNRAACAMYEKCGYHYLDKREPIYAQFTASLNLHDGAMHGRKHYLMCKNRVDRTTWLGDDDLFSETRKGVLGLLG